MNDCTRLAKLLRERKPELLERWRQRTRQNVQAAQPLNRPRLDDHVPMVVQGVIDYLQRDGACASTPPSSSPGAPTHGMARLHDGYEPADVVTELSMLRACTFEIAEAEGFTPSGPVLRAVNDAYDHVIGAAMAGYAAAMNEAIQRHQAEHLSFIAHDLRSPLGNISLAVEALVRSSPPGEADAVAPRLLRNLARNVTQLTRIVDDVLESNLPAVTATQSKALLRASTLKLRTLVEGLVGDLATQADEAGTTFLIDIPPDLQIEADAALLGRALQNLLSNAIEYAAPGTIEVLAEQQGECVHCRVRDHGRGMTGDPLRRALEPTGDSGKASGHCGLGLLIARLFIEAHGGTLRVDSQPEGTTIHITVPLKQL